VASQKWERGARRITPPPGRHWLEAGVPGFLGRNHLAHLGRVDLRGSAGSRGVSTRASRVLSPAPGPGASRKESQLRRGGWDSWMSLLTSGFGGPQTAGRSLHSGNGTGLDVCGAGGSTDNGGSSSEIGSPVTAGGIARGTGDSAGAAFSTGASSTSVSGLFSST